MKGGVGNYEGAKRERQLIKERRKKRLGAGGLKKRVK